MQEQSPYFSAPTPVGAGSETNTNHAKADHELGLSQSLMGSDEQSETPTPTLRRSKRLLQKELCAVEMEVDIHEAIVPQPKTKSRPRTPTKSSYFASTGSDLTPPSSETKGKIRTRRSTRRTPNPDHSSTSEGATCPLTPSPGKRKTAKPKDSVATAFEEKEYDWYTLSTSSIANSIISRPPHTPRYIPLPSPYKLVQESLYANPWALLVATIFLNKTSGRQARPKLFEFLTKYPTPEACAEAKIPDLLEILTPLGLQNRRAARLIAFSRAFLDNPNFSSPTELPGIGKYGEDSWKLFCGRDERGDIGWQKGELEVEDKELKKYVEWRRAVVLGFNGKADEATTKVIGDEETEESIMTEVEAHETPSPNVAVQSVAVSV